MIGLAARHWKAIIAIALLGMIVTLAALWQSARAEAHQNALAVSNARADADQTRELLRDSSGVTWERRARQAELERDKLDRELATRPVLRVPIGVRVDTVHAESEAPVVEEEGVRSAHFAAYQAPVSLEADVSLPTPPGQASIAWRAILDPIDLTARVSCSEDDVSGVRDAFVRVEGPPWASIEIGPTQQDPDVCSPAPGFAFSVGSDVALPVLAGAAEGAAVTLLVHQNATPRDYLLGALTGAGVRLLERLIFR